jgi:hypothetical protein
MEKLFQFFIIGHPFKPFGFVLFVPSYDAVDKSCHVACESFFASERWNSDLRFVPSFNSDNGLIFFFQRFTSSAVLLGVVIDGV